MARLSMEATKQAASTEQLAPSSLMEQRLNAEVPGLGSIKGVRAEIDQMNESMKGFDEEEPDEIMRMCSSFSARLVEIRRRIFRVEDILTYWKPVRTQEVTPLIEETRFQYEVASRILTQRKFDWEMERGT